MGFVHAQLADGRIIGVFAVIDNFTRECVAMKVGTSLCSGDVAVELFKTIQERGRPDRLVCDNGPEFTSSHFQKWARRTETSSGFRAMRVSSRPSARMWETHAGVQRP